MGFPNFYWLHFDCSVTLWHCCGLNKVIWSLYTFPRELHGEINTLYASVCISYNRHLEALFTRPQSMDNMRKSKGIFPVDVRLTLKIRFSIIRLNSRFVFDLRFTSEKVRRTGLYSIVIIGQAPRVGKMNPISRCVWLPERARWRDNARDCPFCSRNNISPKSKRVYESVLSQNIFRDGKKIVCDFSVGMELENEKTEMRHDFFK